MATVITHAVTALTIGNVYADRRLNIKFWLLSIACSILPDGDVLGFAFGIPYESVWGHRGFAHSLTFAAIVSIAVVFCFSNEMKTPFRKGSLLAYFFVITASHGLLDAMTDGGLGVAFFSPFENGRYFLPWRPIPVSPIGSAFLSGWGLEVLKDEIIEIWSVCLIAYVVSRLVRRRSQLSCPSSSILRR